MPITIKVYKCAICGETFLTYEQAEAHEYICNKCNSCKYAYYVYGCEFNCKYYNKGECNAKKRFPRYKRKTKQK